MQIAIENLKTAGAEDYLVIVPARGIQEGRGEDHGGGSGGYGGGDRCYAMLAVVAAMDGSAGESVSQCLCVLGFASLSQQLSLRAFPLRPVSADGWWMVWETGTGTGR